MCPNIAKLILYILTATIFIEKYNADVIYFSNDNKLNVIVEMMNIPDDVVSVMVSARMPNQKQMATIKSIVNSSYRNITMSFEQDVTQCYQGFEYVVLLRYKNGLVCDFQQLFSIDYSTGPTTETLTRQYWIDWENKCRGNNQVGASSVVGENYLETCALGNGFKFIDLFHNVNYNKISAMSAMRLPPQYSLRYKMITYAFDNDTTFLCKNYMCTETNQCTSNSELKSLTVRSYRGDYNLFPNISRIENFYFKIGTSYKFIDNCQSMIYTDANQKIVNVVLKSDNNTQSEITLNMQEKDDNSFLYCFSWTCIIRPEISAYECTRYVIKQIKFRLDETERPTSTTTKKPTPEPKPEENSKMDLKISVQEYMGYFHFKANIKEDSGRTFELYHYLKSGNSLELLRYSVSKYPIELKTVLTVFDNDSTLVYVITDEKESSCYIKNYTIVATPDTITSEIESATVYYIEQKAFQLDCSHGYWVSLSKDNTMKTVINASEVHDNITLGRNDNNTVIYCVKINCILVMNTNNCRRDVRQIRFLMDDPQVPSSPVV